MAIESLLSWFVLCRLLSQYRKNWDFRFPSAAYWFYVRVASTVVVSTWCWSARCSNQIFKRLERITSVTTCHTPSRHATPMTNLNELLVKSSVEFSGKRDWVLSYIEGDVCHLPNSPPKLYWSVIQQVRPVMKNSGRPTIQDFFLKWLVRNHLSIAFENHLHKLDKYESLYRVGVGFPTSTLRGWLESQVSSSTFLKDEKPERWGPVFLSGGRQWCLLLHAGRLHLIPYYRLHIWKIYTYTVVFSEFLKNVVLCTQSCVHIKKIYCISIYFPFFQCQH